MQALPLAVYYHHLGACDAPLREPKKHDLRKSGRVFLFTGNLPKNCILPQYNKTIEGEEVTGCDSKY